MVATLSLIIGLTGLFAMTWLFPVVSSLLIRSNAGSRSKLRRSSRGLHAAILIPAHNEERNLKITLRSVKAAIAQARKVSPGIEISVLVGADGCTDGTAAVARAGGARVVELKNKSGKWLALSKLVREAQGADWVILADAGIVWPREFLAKVLPLMSKPDLVAVAPTYRAPDSGTLERIVWGVEAHFKKIETSLGGPISIHGATICYRRRELLAALRHLNSARGAWLNDDVVVPLTLRTLFPALRIQYLSDVGVFDNLRAARQGQGLGKTGQREYGRRRRMVYGNLQWIRGLLPEVFGQNSQVALLALRRAFRVLWAYWGIALFVGSAVVVDPAYVMATAFAALGAALLVRGPFVKLWDSARASLLAPYYFFSVHNLSGVGWK